MRHETRIRRIASALRFRYAMLEDERDDRALRLAVVHGQMVRVVPGCYIESSQWNSMRLDEQLLARTIAVAHRNRERPPLFSHLSAAVIWGLPLYGLPKHQPERVHKLHRRSEPGRSSQTILRHFDEWSDDEECLVEGLRVTSLSRTIIDLARRASPESAIMCADAGLRLLFNSRRDSGPDEVQAWKEQQLGLLGAMPGRYGVRGARQIVQMVDPRADSPAESLSRLQLERLGVAYEIQVRVRGLNGRDHWIDFYFTGQRMFGEVDGRAKYTDPGLMGGRTIEQLVLDEKAREDEVRGITQEGFARWGWEHIGTARHLGYRLQAFGLEVPRLG